VFLHYQPHVADETIATTHQQGNVVGPQALRQLEESSTIQGKSM